MTLLNEAGSWLKRTFRKPGIVILFIDFDGVLHSFGHTDNRPWIQFEQVPRLQAVLKCRPHVKVVVHSSWRRGYDLDEIENFLDIGDNFEGVTDKSIMERWPSIIHWLAKQRVTWPPPHYVILDDMWYAFPHEIRTENLIATDPKIGMSELQWRELEQRLDNLAYAGKRRTNVI